MIHSLFTLLFTANDYLASHSVMSQLWDHIINGQWVLPLRRGICPLKMFRLVCWKAKWRFLDVADEVLSLMGHVTHFGKRNSKIWNALSESLKSSTVVIPAYPSWAHYALEQMLYWCCLPKSGKEQNNWDLWLTLTINHRWQTGYLCLL